VIVTRAAILPLLVALALTACGTSEPGADQRSGSTLDATLVDRDGDGALEPGPGEPLRDRRELGGGGKPGETLATFAQITDAHVRDEESPARVPFLDRLGAPFTSTFRPQEALTPHVLAATVRELNRLRPEAVLVTGDLVDSDQENEWQQALTTLNGGRVRPDSGARGYRGVQEADNPDPFYYRPDHDPPRHPGLLDRAQRPFDSPGLEAPWFPMLGNHDLLVAGEVPPTPRIAEVATGDRMVTDLDPGLRPQRDTDAPAAVDALLAHGLPGRTARVPADPRRRALNAEEVLALVRRPGHAGRLDYAFDIGRHVRAIALDTVRREGGSAGVVTPDQAAWLREQLAAAGDRYVIVLSHHSLAHAEGGQAALATLDGSPRVVAAISGHAHRNQITPRRAGYWLIATASLVDFPQQARAFRLCRTSDGVALETWMVDHDGAGLAGTSRELAFLDAQGGRPQRFAGRPEDRNARLYLR
jgi:hypothetical protein